jgi:hypothetical protein
MRGLTDAIACTGIADGSGVAEAALACTRIREEKRIRGTGEAMKFGISLPTEPPIGAQVEEPERVIGSTVGRVIPITATVIH